MGRRSILWLENDPGNIDSLLMVLRRNEFDITLCKTVSEAETALACGRYDLLILDVMIPVTAEELPRYPYDQTEETLRTGLVFYKFMRDRLAASSTNVLVMTARIDSDIASRFTEAGLPEHQFATRYEMRDTRAFVARVTELAGGER